MIGSRPFSFLLWSAIFAGLFGALYLLLRKRFAENTFAKLNAIAGPQLLTLFWLHGIVCNPPNNFSVIKRSGFVGFWLQPHRADDFTNHTGLFLVFLGAGPILLIAGLLVSKRFAKTATGLVWPLVGLCLWYLAAFCFRQVPDAAIDLFLGNSSLSVSNLFDDNPYHPVAQVFRTDAIIPFFVGLALSTCAFLVTRATGGESSRKKGTQAHGAE